VGLRDRTATLPPREMGVWFLGLRFPCSRAKWMSDFSGRFFALASRKVGVWFLRLAARWVSGFFVSLPRGEKLDM
jgi:hypothetical protein